MITTFRTPLEVFRMYEDVLLPYRAKENAIGLDVHAYLKTEMGRPNNMLIPPRATRAVPTGLIVSPPEGYAVFVCSRSGLAKEYSLFVTNAPGVIDPDYRGELMVLLYNGGHESYYVKHEDRVGQLILFPCWPSVTIENPGVDFDTDRGTDGFGSTGR